MNEKVRGVVVAHADLAGALVSAVEKISGVTGALRPVSNEGLGPEALQGAIRRAAAGRRTILFVDVAGGSCGVAGLRHVRENGDAVCITGTSLPMLLDFVFHREMPLDALVARLLLKGRRGQQAHPDVAAATD
ncbi:PTS sugar transporter subunit IIA [Candidatus Palauibacter sp.]|uniref:PTS sugar transporter subunit IIA n=1 Tax=Candidatus Palauibacter sp. TaxID=3101350 RepID=UPI003B01D53A